MHSSLCHYGSTPQGWFLVFVWQLIVSDSALADTSNLSCKALMVVTKAFAPLVATYAPVLAVMHLWQSLVSCHAADNNQQGSRGW